MEINQRFFQVLQNIPPEDAITALTKYADILENGYSESTHSCAELAQSLGHQENPKVTYRDFLAEIVPNNYVWVHKRNKTILKYAPKIHIVYIHSGALRQEPLIHALRKCEEIKYIEHNPEILQVSVSSAVYTQYTAFKLVQRALSFVVKDEWINDLKIVVVTISDWDNLKIVGI